MTSRREQKERLRRERERREAAAEAADRQRKTFGYIAGGIVALFVAALLIAFLSSTLGGEDSGNQNLLPGGGHVPAKKVTKLGKAAKRAKCKLRTFKNAKGVADHTKDENEKITYATNPPTYGRHFIEPAKDGAYAQAPKLTKLVHNLEHGRIVIWFQPSLSRKRRADLKALFDEDSYQMVLVPKPDMPYEVAATAWNGKPKPGGTGRMLACKRYRKGIFDAIRAFKEKNRGKGPERVP